MARGKAAPIVKRKNGNTRSTHVMPFTLGSKPKSGGGVCPWNIHAGRFGKYMFAQRIIAKIVIPLRMSMVMIRLVAVGAMIISQ